VILVLRIGVSEAQYLYEYPHRDVTVFIKQSVVHGKKSSVSRTGIKYGL